MIATIQIGNSDDKLSQLDWSMYVAAVRNAIKEHGIGTHFVGGSAFDTEWQNACFVVSVPELSVELLITTLRKIRRKYRQNAIAIVLGDVRLI